MSDIQPIVLEAAPTQEFGTLLSECKDIKQLRMIAEQLYCVLDDISTMSDIAKGDDRGYRRGVEMIQLKKGLYLESDGYHVYLKKPERIEKNFYSCARCGYEGPCYGTLVGDKISAVWCMRCGGNDQLQKVMHGSSLPRILHNPSGPLILCTDGTMHPLSHIERLWLRIGLTSVTMLNTKYREDLDCKS